jgi:DNA replication protein DnaC
MKTICPLCKTEFEITSIPPGFEKLMAGLASRVACDACDEQQQKQEAEKRSAKDREIFLSRSRLPQSLIEWDSRLGNNNLLAWVNEHVSESLYIPGTYGICKTRAICAAAYQNKALHPFMKFYTSSGLISEIMGYYSEGVREVNEFKEMICSLDLLIMDDLGKEKITDRAGELLFDLIDSFYVGRGKLWITTNQTSREELIEKLGADRGMGIIRRIAEKCRQYNKMED